MKTLRAHPGLFITFEGGEGAGKTTQARLLAGYLRERGYPVLLTREPGGPEVSERIRDLLLDSRYKGIMHERTELLLYAASRAQHVAEWILPALRAGKVVISDRFADATFAYQGYGRGLPLDQLIQLHHIATGGLKPDRTFLLDLPPETGFQRVQARGEHANRLEIEAVSFHERVRAGYLQLASDEPERVCVIDATASVDAIQATVRNIVCEMLQARGLAPPNQGV